MNTIFWAGDSTVQYNDIGTYPQTGIGQVFHLFLRSNIKVENRARNGRSTKSFIDEGRLAAIEKKISEGDFLFIQFGHNDEKSEDPTRYTDPKGSFKENLKIFIRCAEEKGAHPVLISPIPRRHFENELLSEGIHGPYVDAMRETSEETETPFIDLHTAAWKVMSEAGEKKTREWHMFFEAGQYENYPDGKQDNTHLRYEGAVKYASLIAQGLKDLGGIYQELLVISGGEIES